MRYPVGLEPASPFTGATVGRSDVLLDPQARKQVDEIYIQLMCLEVNGWHRRDRKWVVKKTDVA